MIDVTNGTNVHVRLRSLEDGVRSVDVEGRRHILRLERVLERVGSAARSEGLARGAQERRQRSQSRRHCEDVKTQEKMGNETISNKAEREGAERKRWNGWESELLS